MEVAAVLAAFDEQMRRSPAVDPAARVERGGRVTRVVAGAQGWSGVLWSSLTDADAGPVIAAQIRRFAAHGDGWEWKRYSHDRPADLPERLLAVGFVPGGQETVLVAQIAELPVDPRPRAGVDLVAVTGQQGVDALVAVHDEVFGGDHHAIGQQVLAGLATRPPSVAAVVAVAADTAVSAGRVEFPAGRDFASLWGGGTLPAGRGRGVFGALVACRAALARDRGYRYLHADASADSRPILRRLGFTQIATTTPYRYVGPKR